MENWASLGADVVLGVIPFIPSGAGAGIKTVGKAANKIDNIIDAGKAIGKTANKVDNLIDSAKVLKGADNATELITGNVKVYKATKGAQDYYGITNNLARRSSQHSKNGIKITSVIDGSFTRSQAKGIEQALINANGRALVDGGTLANKINSIARSNSIYNKSVKYGERIIKAARWLPFG